MREVQEHLSSHPFCNDDERQHIQHTSMYSRRSIEAAMHLKACSAASNRTSSLARSTATASSVQRRTFAGGRWRQALSSDCLSLSIAD